MEKYGNKPIINSYCAGDRLYAGEYPGDKSADKAKEKLAEFCSFGITHFIDLTEEGELEPYAHLLPEGVVHRRFPIVDVSVPESHDAVTDLLVYIDHVLSSSEASKVYVHCWGGVGRTGTIIGCYYVHKGCDFVSALVRLRESFKQCPKSERRKSPETLEQEKFIADYARIRDRIDDNVESIVSETTNEIREVKIMTPDKDRIRGSLIGGAIGDALGYPVEFIYDYRTIQKKYGEKGITRHDTTHWWKEGGEQDGKAWISDDTQMTLFTACGLLNAQEKLSAPAYRNYFSPDEIRKHSICSAYLEWYYTQICKPGRRPLNCWIRQCPEINQKRAPGHTCLGSLMEIHNGREPHNNSKGCGGVMRVAPIALFGLGEDRLSSMEAMDKLAAEAAEMTHQNPLGYIPAAMMAHIIYRLATDPAPTRYALYAYTEEAMKTMDVLYPAHASNMEYMRMLVNKAFTFAASDLSDNESVELIGGGWVGDEALAIALYCAAKHFDDFEKAMIAAVNHAGDSDSTGAIAGNILGAAIGYEALPEFYKKDLELHDVIIHVADDLYEGKVSKYH